MQKLDRLGWTAGISLKIFDVTIGVRVNDPRILDRILACVNPAWVSDSEVVDMLYSLIVGQVIPGARTRRYHLLYGGAGLRERSMDIDDIFRKFEDEFPRVVSIASRDKIYIHAAVVEWHGQALVILNRNDPLGTKNLFETLLTAGGKIYSERFAVIDNNGYVHPFLTPGFLERSMLTDPEPDPLPISLILMAVHHEGAQWRAQKVPSGTAMLSLLAHTVNVRLVPDNALSTFQYLRQS